MSKIKSITEAAIVLNPDDLAPEFSEEALAIEFARRHADELRYVAVWGRWLYWNGKHWQFDDKRKVFTLARAVCREAAARLNSQAAGTKIASAKTRAAVVSLASEDRRLVATIDQWDADPWLLSTPDGVVDLRNGGLKAALPGNYMTKATAVGPSGDCPLWNQFLDKVTGGDQEVRSYLQRASGYCLTGLTTEQVLFFLYGKGGNGKGVFISTIAGAMGAYHKAAPIEAFTANMTDRHPTELAGLMGARLVTATETEEGRSWAESRIKHLTGGDAVPARFMRQDFFEYIPQFKLMFAGNHQPGLRTVDDAIRRRMNLVLFGVKIAEEEVDRELVEKLKAEWPGILQWMIEGCRQWQAEGLKPPKAVTDATAKYLKSEDTFQRWLDDCCRIGPQHWAPFGKLWMCWKQWAEAAGQYVGTDKRLIQRLEAHGFTPERQKSQRGYLGLTIYQEPPTTEKEPPKIWEEPF